MLLALAVSTCVICHLKSERHTRFSSCKVFIFHHDLHLFFFSLSICSNHERWHPYPGQPKSAISWKTWGEVADELHHLIQFVFYPHCFFLTFSRHCVFCEHERRIYISTMLSLSILSHIMLFYMWINRNMFLTWALVPVCSFTSLFFSCCA